MRLTKVYVLVAVACAAAPVDAQELCTVPGCCLGTLAEETIGENAAIAKGAVTDDIRPGRAVLRYSLPVYCFGGVDCPTGYYFPDVVHWGAEFCGQACPECDALEWNDEGLFLVDLMSSCLLRVIPVDELGAHCPALQVLPTEFALEIALRSTSECVHAQQEAGYNVCDDSDSNGGCSHAGQAGGPMLGLVIGLVWLTRRLQTARSCVTRGIR